MAWTSKSLTVLVLIFVFLLPPPAIFCLQSQTLNRHIVSNISTGALCNDGSPAIYYLRNNVNSSKWMIYLEGGGGCNSVSDCRDRFRKTPYFMSSKQYPEKINTKTILAVPEFHDHNKAILVYCSSDLWLGNDINFNNNNSKTNEGIDFVFRGAVIFSTVLMELLAKGLNNATDVMVIGQSAGGIGAINHLNFISSVLPKDHCKLSIVLDSAWFIDFENYFRNQFGAGFATSTGVLERRACRDTSWGFPCCFSLFCMMSNSYLPPDIPMFLMQSKYDIYVLFQRLLQQNTHLENVLQNTDILLQVHSYGGRMQQSFDIVDSRRNLNYISTSCFHHGYLVSSTLWDTVYKKEIELDFPSVRFKHVMNDSHWDTIKVGNHSIKDVFFSWASANSNQSTTAYASSIDKSIKINDLCAHAQCNPTCPQLIYYDQYDTRWSFWKKVILIAFVLFITIGCLVTKCLWIVQHRNLKQTQALYLGANYEGSDLYGKVMCLPTCPPHSAIGISCSELDYDISNFPNTETGTLLRKRKNGVAATADTNKLRVRKRSSYTMNKKIIKGVTAYFNPGQLVAIMGPSGSGKTTLLDVITARKHLEEAESNIFINGLPADETREWFIKNSGYVLQLATPYHEELTVRQNLTYSAMMRLPMKMKIQDKMWRVEQVLGQCGLYDVADVVVGDNSFTGGGLSGGQKRRLCIALQLLDLPSVIFLDEPTSGLDSASSLELLETLHSLTLSGRLVVVTIHQPRIEIFHMFDAILLLCEGQVAYFGSPIIAPTMIAEALKDSGQTFDASNPADSIMDVLTNPEAQKIILDYYLQSGEIQAINRAIARARRHPQKTLSMKFQKQTSSIQNRLLALDGRTSASQTLSQSFYFPLIYLLYALALGTCYWKTHKGVLLMSCYMVFSCASQLFLASVIHGHLHKAFALFELEKADGIGHATELILHVFIRTFSKSSIPLVVACGIIYLCTIQDYVLWKFCLTTLIHLQLNQTWIAIIVFTACCTPRYSTLVSPLLSAIAGFAGGFLVPEPQMPLIYYWLFYINPTHWAYSGMMKVLITDVVFQCKWDSPLECQTTTGIVVLSEFGFSERNPYVSMFILLVMLISFLLLSVVVLEIKYSKRKWDKRKKNYLQAITQSIRSCYNSLMVNYNRKKREAEEEERKRLFKLVEHQYQYKGEIYPTPQDEEGGGCEKGGGRTKRPTYEPLKDHSQGKGEWVDRKRSNTVTSNDLNDDLFEETENSSNDEDIDPTLNLRQPKHKLSFQQNSFTSIFTKLQSGLTKTNSFDNNNDSPPPMNGEEAVPYRAGKKKRQWRKAFAQRRKTFTGFIEEGVEEESKPYSRWRPKSMLLPDRHHEYINKLHRTKSNMTEHSKLSRTNTISSSRTTVIERKKSDEQGNTPTASLSIVRRRPQPPDIVIDIERAIIPEESRIMESKLTPRQAPKTSFNSKDQAVASRPPSRPPSHVMKHKNHSKRKKKKDPKAKDTWSKYLDVHPKRHEVYCALNSIKKRLRGSGRGVRGALKKSESVHLQRKASTLILDEKKDSMRTQLFGLQRTYTDDSDYSPTTMKRLLLLKSRQKFFNKNSAVDEQPIPPLEETQVVPRSPKRRLTGDRALLERLSALSSQRNSARSSVGTTLSSKRSSKSNSVYNHLDSPVNDVVIPVVNNQTSAQIYNVLRKLNDSIDELETDDIDPTNPNRIKPDSGMKSESEKQQHRLSDPLLPEERHIIENLLSKYSMLEGKPPSMLEEPIQEKKEETMLFSSKVKIRGASPYHSRTGSVIKRNLSKSTESSSSSVPKEESRHSSLSKPSSPNESLGQQSNTATPTQEIGPVFSLIKDHHTDIVKKSAATDSNQSTPKFTPRGTPRTRKISTVKEFTMKFEAQNQRHLVEPKFTIVPEQKFYQVSSESDSSSDSSSSSEYEDTIVKTNEGFIIPDDAIEKLPINKAAKAQRLREEQEEIERQFKKENFLKDLPVRHRGIRMPTGSAGKVNLLKSKFEGKSIANSIATERRNASLRNASQQLRHQQASRIQATNNDSSLNAPATSKQPRTFFKKRRQISRSTGSDSDGTVELNPMKSSGNLLDSSFDDSKSCSSERDFMQAFHENKSYLLPQTIPRQDFSDSQHSDDSLESGQSFHSDRKRKHVPIFRFNRHEDLERWV